MRTTSAMLMGADSTAAMNRLNRFVRFLSICSAIWFVVGCYYQLTQRPGPSVLCFGEALFTIALVAFREHISKRFLVNTALAATTLGVCFGSYNSGPDVSSVSTFFCVPVLLAAYQLGPRAMWCWAAVCIGCLSVVYLLPPTELSPTSPPIWLDKFAGQIMIVLLVAVFTWVAENSAEAYANQLVSVSEELRAGADKLSMMVGMDALTKLPNRLQFHRDFEDALARAKAQETGLAVLLIDLDGFKQINDRLGHAAGDRVLCDVANRLSEAVDSKAGKIARLGGDEFTVILEHLSDDFTPALTGGKIVRSISRDYRIDGQELKLGASVGVATFPKDGSSIDELISFADAAMYDAKAKKLGVQLYVPSMTEAAEEKRQLISQLDAAIAQNEFALVYQPQIDIRGNQISGAEALLRWKRDGEFVSPAEFIAQLEDSGNILEVGRWVMEEACGEAKRWYERGVPVRMSVNVSSVQFEQPSFVDDVWNAFERHSLDPDLLDLELTETVFLENPKQAIQNIEMLRDAGISISIDDFGTGYSSLGYLKALPINRLKIDRSFIKDIPDDDDGMIAETIITLAHNLGISVIAEGVDTDAQLDFLRHRGCDEYQGYLFSRPVSGAECLRLLQRSRQADDTSETKVPSSLTNA